jgi:hypothetical protein
MDFDAIDRALADDQAAGGHISELCAIGWRYDPARGVVECMCGRTVPLPATDVLDHG